MSYTFLLLSGSPTGDKTATATGGGSGDWRDPVGVTIASQPQSIDIQIGDDGYVSSATIDFIGGSTIPPGGVGGPVSTTAYGKAPISISADGFRPYASLVIEGAGPAGMDAITANASSAGVLSSSGLGILPFYGSSFQPGSVVPSASVAVRESRESVATFGGFPGDLWESLYYAVGSQGGNEVKYYLPSGSVSLVPGGYAGSRTVYMTEHKAYAKTLYAGYTDTHTVITQETPVSRTILSRQQYRLSFNTFGRRHRSRIEPGDAVFIRALAPSVWVEIEIDEEDAATWRRASGFMAYVLTSDGKVSEAARRVSNSRWIAGLSQGESLIISPVELGTGGRSLDLVYPWGQFPAGDGEETDGVTWYPIPTRSKVYRRVTGSVIASTFIKPGIGRMKVTVV